MMDTRTIEWRPVVGYEDLYAVSSTGLIMRTKLTRGSIPGKILKPSLCKTNGYYMVNLYRDCIKKTVTIHRLVACAFLGIDKLNREVNHIDGIKSNNSLSNLEYVTRSQNGLHAYRMGLNRKRTGENCPSSKLTEAQVKKIREEYPSLKTPQLSQKYRMSINAISAIIHRRTWANI